VALIDSAQGEREIPDARERHTRREQSVAELADLERQVYGPDRVSLSDLQG
jgi:hypothetical protein